MLECLFGPVLGWLAWSTVSTPVAFAIVSVAQDEKTATQTPAPEPQQGVVTGVRTTRMAEISGRSAASAPVSFLGVFGRGEFRPGSLSVRVDGASQPAQVDVVSTWLDGSIASAHVSWSMPVAAHKTYFVDCIVGEHVAPPAQDWQPAPFGDGLDFDLLLVDGADLVWTVRLLRAADFVEALGKQTVNTALGAPCGGMVTELEWPAKALEFVPLPGDPEQPRVHPELRVVVRARVFPGWNGVWVEVAVEHCTAQLPMHSVDFKTVRLRSGSKVFAQLERGRHRPQVRWLVSTWVGETPPQFSVRPDVAGLAAIGVIPPLDADRPVNERAAREKLDTWIGGAGRGSWDLRTPEGTPLCSGIVYQHQPGTGDRLDIGWFPTWCLFALNGGSPAALQMARIGDLNGSAAFPVHVRDPDSGLLGLRNHHEFWSGEEARIVHHGELDKNPLTPNVAHMPLLGLTTYLLEGRTAALEEFLCWTAFALRDQWPNNGLIKSFGREGAWALRNLVLAVTLTPDRHPLKPYFLEIMERNLAAWVDAAPLWTHPLGFFGEGSSGGSGRKSTPCTLFQSPWQMAWFFSMACVGYRLHQDERFLLPVKHHWKYWLGYLQEGKTWKAPNGETVAFDIDSMVEYSKVVSVYTPYLDEKREWQMKDVRPLEDFAEACWYQCIQDQYAASKLTAEMIPADPRPESWQPRGGRYVTPKWNAWHEYGPGRTALHWLAVDVGLPRAHEVARVLDPLVRAQVADRRLPAGVCFVALRKK